MGPAARAYRLVIRRDGVTTPAAVAPEPHPFDLDAGSGAHGRPTLVYTLGDSVADPSCNPGAAGRGGPGRTGWADS